MNTKLLIFLPFVLGLSACSMFERTENSGYAYDNGETSNASEFYAQRSAGRFQRAKQELGINSQELAENEIRAIQARVELNRLEKKLEYEQEKKQYYSLKPYFRNDNERIYFLKLSDKDSRARWAAARGIGTNEAVFDTSTNRLIENNDIAKGMSRDAVKQSWGEPDIVEVAGQDMYGNERWRYSKLVSTDSGYKSETRIIYFESGRVVGWETL